MEAASEELWQQIASNPLLTKGDDKRAALVSVLKLWQEAHASER